MRKFLQISQPYGLLLIIILLQIRCCQGCNMTNCSNCSNSQYFQANSSCYQCSTLMSDCKICSNATTCITCNETYGFNNTNQCRLCSSLMTNCLTCINSTWCNTCVNATYGINYTSNKCQACSTLIPYCITCYSDYQCTSCSGNPLIVLNNKKCINCAGAIPNCYKCVNPNHCTLCNSYFALFETAMNSTCILCMNLMHGCENCSSATVCVKCSMGKIVPMGCTSVPGCTSVIQNPPISICTSCDFTEFQVLPINGVCICIKGFLAGQYCTEILGCTSIMRNISGDFCIGCNQKGYYYLTNNSCACLPYFQPNGQLCKQICGDGRVYVQPCDDGNLIDGDGCSSSCKVEPMYSCKGGANNSASICKYEGRIKAELSCVYKLDTANSALIQIKLTPAISSLSKINFNNFVSFNFSVHCEVTSIELTGDILAIKIVYFADLEQSNATIIVGFDPYYIHSPSTFIFIIFKDCNGDLLTYQSVQSSKQTVSFISKIFSIIVLLLWMFGSYFHKLIGVETLHTIHLIFIMQAFAPRYRPVVIYFSELRNSLNFFQGALTSSAPLDYHLYQLLNQSSNFIYNLGLVTLFDILVILVFMIVKIIRLISSDDTTTEYHKVETSQEKKMKKIQNFLYDCLLFPTLIGFFFSLSISIDINSTSSIAKFYSNYSHVSLGILLAFSATAMVFFQEWKWLFIVKKTQKPLSYKDNYVSCYLIYVLSLSLTISLSLHQLIKHPLLIFAAITTIYLIFIIIYSPYQDKVHKIGIIINSTAVLINLAWLISQEHIYLSRIFDQIIAFIIMGGISLAIICSLIRIIFELCKSKEIQPIEKQEKNRGEVQSYDQYQKQMVRAIVAQTQKNINYYKLTSQLLRAREVNVNGDLKPVFKKRFRYNARDQDNEDENMVYSSIIGNPHNKQIN